MINFGRRNFLKTTGALSLISTSGGLLSAVNNLHAADAEGYKALVCIFLKGGMDHADSVLPYDQLSYDRLVGYRSELFNSYNYRSESSSRNRNNLLELLPGNDFDGRRFALPRELAAFHELYEAGDGAIVGNIGPLIEPTTRAQKNSGAVAVPRKLYSHNDQQSTWMSLAEESGTRFGWGGRMLDKSLVASDDKAFNAITTAGNDIFLSGESVVPFRVASNPGAGGPIRILDSNYRAIRQSAELQQLLVEHYSSADLDAVNLLERDIAHAHQRGYEKNLEFGAAFQQAQPLGTEFPASGLGQQLKTIARTISVNQVIGANRQVFYAAIGGFDTHSGQAQRLPQLHMELAEAMAAFNNAMYELGTSDNVTLYTMSDFGRTLVSNDSGTDHGWGGHAFVAGGAVKGGRIYGDIPDIDAMGSSEYFLSGRGRAIPTTSVDQLISTLGSWFGLNDTELLDIAPNLQNFPQRDLGFLA